LFYQRHEESSLSGVAADKTNKNPAGVHLSFAGLPPGITAGNPHPHLIKLPPANQCITRGILIINT
jgi:hypothetical protein